MFGSCNIDDHRNGAADVNGGEVENIETGGALCEQNWSQRQQQPGKCTWTFSFTSPPIGPIFLSHTNLSHVQVLRIPILSSTKAQVFHMQYFYSGIIKLRGQRLILYSVDTICEMLRFRQIDSLSILSELGHCTGSGTY